VAAALAEPMDFPPLAAAVVPGDTVAIALEEGLPQAPALVAGAVAASVKAGVEPRNVTILQSAREAAAGLDVRSGLPPDLAAEINLVTHDPDDRDRLAYIAASAAGEPVYVNRLLSDADVVLPIGCLRLDSSAGYHGIHTAIFPTYSDAATQRRFFSSSNEDSPKHHKRRRDEAAEAAWLLGVLTSIQIVPGGSDAILHVLAGSVDTVTKRGRELCLRAWRFPIDRRADLVVAGIPGSAAAQTWDNVARALASAASAVTDGGAIALCTELATAPGPALGWLAADDDYESALRSVRKERSPDAAAASHLLRALDRNRVFLLSLLADETVSDLGMTPIEQPADVARLCRRSQSCIVLSNAQYAVPWLNEEVPTFQ
jgi:nickel-dependent lactate racemase